MKKIKTLFLLLFILASFRETKAEIKSSQPIKKKHILAYVPLIEGYFYQTNSDGKVYWFVNGKTHWIANYETYEYLFQDPANYTIYVTNYRDLAQNAVTLGPPRGVEISAGTTMYEYNGVVYFANGGRTATKLQIPNPTTVYQYHLRWATQTLSSPPSPIGTFPSGLQ